MLEDDGAADVLEVDDGVALADDVAGPEAGEDDGVPVDPPGAAGDVDRG